MTTPADPIERAVACFNNEEYREALLAFEERWFAERSDFWKAMIQLCNGLLQLQLGLVTGPRRTLESAHGLLAIYTPRYAGFDVEGLRAYIATVRVAIPADLEGEIAAGPWEGVPRMRIEREVGDGQG